MPNSPRAGAVAIGAVLTLAAGLVVAGSFSSQATEGRPLGAGARNLESSVTTSQPLSRATVFRAGSAGDVIDTGALWSFDLDPGTYTVSMRAIMNVTPNDPNATAASVICGVIDLETFNTPNTRVYVADSTVQLPGGLPAAMSGASTIRIGPNATPGAICISPDSSLELFKPVVFSFGNLDRRTISDADPVDIDQRQLRSFTPR